MAIHSLPQQTTDTATGLVAGVYIVTVTNQFGCIYIDTVVVHDVTGITDILDSQIISLYPNPTNGIIQINFTNALQEPVLLKLLSVEGKLVRDLGRIESNDSNFDLSAIAKGAYILQFESSQGRVSKRIILR